MSEHSPLIVLLTDFGLRDPFVGMMKGVMACIAPHARCIDLTHDISPHSIPEGMLVLQAAYRYFPLHAIFLVVVDPGVGSERRPLLVVTEKYRFVAPDNGILTPIFQQERVSRILKITARQYFLERINSTFHGRDIFAPVAAWLANGVEPAAFGPEIRNPISLPLPHPQWINNTTIQGEIIYIDRFGNLISNIATDTIEELLHIAGTSRVSVHFRTYDIPSLSSAYAEQEEGKLGALLNSWGLLELFLKQQSAHAVFQASKGEKIELPFSA